MPDGQPAAFSRHHDYAAPMPPPSPQEGAQQGRTRPVEFQTHHLEEELMNALVVEDSPQIAERYNPPAEGRR